ncbi:hypothetical protein C2S52_008585 [Perilla frutescens var. hirtella]|nr:hypothetical protein C2S52_008585 [Perilla frutescens var. hirtella]
MGKKIKLLANKLEAEYPHILQTGFNSVLHKWTEKLIGFVYEMHYKKWTEIRPVEALSGIEEGKEEYQLICRLELFESSKVHPMFHILLLKEKIRVHSELPDDPKGEAFCITPYAFLKIRAIERDKETITHVLVPWEEGGNSSLVDSTSVYTEGLVKGEKLVPWQVVEAPKTNGIVLFSKETFREKEVSHVNHLKRKAEQELHLILSVELKIGSSIIVITNLTGDSFSPVKSAKSRSVLCLETQEVNSSVAKTVTADVVSADKKIVMKNFSNLDPCGQGSENGGGNVVNLEVKEGKWDSTKGIGERIAEIEKMKTKIRFLRQTQLGIRVIELKKIRFWSKLVRAGYLIKCILG